MKRFVGVAVGVFALLMFVGVAQSADVNTAKGTTSFVFQWSGLSNLNVNAYQGGVGLRHYLQDGLAIRPGVELGISSEKLESQSEGVTDDESSSTDIGVSVVLEKHKDIGVNSLSPWIGVGAGFSLSSATDEPARPVGQETKLETSSFGFGAFVAAGFEAAVLEGVTLGGQYQAGVRLSSDKVEVDGETTGEGSSFRFGFSAVALYLSVRIM